MNGAAVIQPAPIPFYTVLVLYLGIMAFIGWYAGRKTNNIGDFFVLSGKAGVVVSGIAYFSTQFSMGTFLGTPGTIYGVGYAGMAIFVVPILFGIYWKKATAKGAIASVIVGIISLLLFTLNPSVKALAMGFHALFPTTIIASIVMIVVSKFTETPPQETIDRHFTV